MVFIVIIDDFTVSLIRHLVGQKGGGGGALSGRDTHPDSSKMIFLPKSQYFTRFRVVGLLPESG